MEKQENPDPVDIHVGERLRARRLELGLTQQVLSGRAKISYQQLQKYEHGMNRISASRLFNLACILGVSPGWFFDGLRQDNAAAKPVESASLDWLRLWSRISAVPPGIRNAYIEFGQSLSRRLGS